MNRLLKVYLKDIFRTFVLFSCVFSIVFSLIGLFDRYDNYVSSGLSGTQILAVVVLRVPEYLGYIIPMSFMLSLVLVLSFSSRNREILIMKVSGINIRRFLVPFLLLSVLVMFFQIFIQEVIYPVSKRQGQKIEGSESRGFLYRGGSLWLKVSRDEILRAKGFDPFNGQMSDVFIFFFNGKGINRIVHAKRAVRSGKIVALIDATTYDLGEKRVDFKKNLSMNIKIDEDILRAGRQRIEAMSGFELLRIYSSLKKGGIENIKLGVDLQRRLAFPVYTIILALVGIYLSLRFSSPWLSIGFSAVSLVAVWAGITLFTALGYAGSLSPVVSGWLLPLSGIFFSLWLFFRIKV